MITKNLVWSATLLFLSATAIYIASGFPTLPKQVVGAGTFPMLISVLIGLCGLILGISEIASIRGSRIAQETGAEIPPYSRSVPALLALGAVPLSCAYLSDFIGFTLAAAIPTSVFMLALRREKAVKTALLCLGFCAFIFWVFTKGLLVPLASGPLGTPLGI